MIVFQFPRRSRDMCGCFHGIVMASLWLRVVMIAWLIYAVTGYRLHGEGRVSRMHMSNVLMIRRGLLKDNKQGNDLQVPITFTANAIDQLKRLMAPSCDGLFVRIGTKKGGCSGLTYMMDIIDSSAVTLNDEVITFDDIHCVVDTRSLLYLFGLNLDYSHALIGGGFKFSNPTAVTSCACGKSFGIA